MTSTDAGGALELGDIEVSVLASAYSIINMTSHLFVDFTNPSGILWARVHRLSMAQVQDHTGGRRGAVPSRG